MRLRPVVYHLTAARNLARIRRTRVLESAGRLLDAAGRHDLVRARRRGHEIVVVDADEIHIRDQAPLHPGNLRLDSGWTFDEFVTHLNRRVFFWPGTTTGPISYGRRHYERYREENPVVIRASLASLLSANPGRAPAVCRYNSGSPRCSYGQPSPRGGRTFQAVESADFAAAGVVEIVFEDVVELPTDAEVGSGLTGPWTDLYDPIS